VFFFQKTQRNNVAHRRVVGPGAKVGRRSEVYESKVPRLLGENNVERLDVAVNQARAVEHLK
jgi:hypothetical protein